MQMQTDAPQLVPYRRSIPAAWRLHAAQYAPSSGLAVALAVAEPAILLFACTGKAMLHVCCCEQPMFSGMTLTELLS